MKPVSQLIRVIHGSQLYGTSTPQSDRDFKGVHLPSGEGIILQRAEDVIERNVTAKEGTKNTADAVDDQSYSLQKFLGMLMKGDTVATEILFAPVQMQLEGNAPRWEEIQTVGRQLINRQCKGFVGYCVRQAAKYGIKGSRMSAVKKVVDFLFQNGGKGERLAVIEQDLRALSEGQEHMQWENIPHPDGRDCWHFVCCDRKVPMTCHIVEAYNIYNKVWQNYGERARAAMTNEGIDWKAVSHAMRVAGQAQELMLTGMITFPRPDASYLLAIKQGKLPYKEISGELEWAVENVHRCAEQSKLPENSDHQIADALVRRLYLEQVL